MIALHKYKHKITKIIIQCVLNGQYFVFVRKIKFGFISIKVIGHIFFHNNIYKITLQLIYKIKYLQKQPLIVLGTLDDDQRWG